MVELIEAIDMIKSGHFAERWIVRGGREMNESALEFSELFPGESFSEKISVVECSRDPLDGEMVELDLISDPMIAHVNCFGVFGFDG
jgi:hypothetical protein